MSSRGRGRGRRGGGGHRGGGEEVQMSKALSFTLRHGALKEGLKIRPDGYVNVAQLLRMHKFLQLNLDFDTLQRLVRDSDKQRYTLASIDENGEPVPIQFKAPQSTVTETTAADSTSSVTTITNSIETITLNPTIDSSDPSKYLIRATQGHSIPITSAALQLKAITKDSLPPICIHGTFYAFFELILATGGLKKMGRNHIHFAPGLPAGFADGTGPAVISGMRRDAQLLFYIDIAGAIDAGIPFWTSENGVILSEGDESKGGVLSMDYVEKVVDVGGSNLGTIWERGKGLLQELPAKLRNKGVPRGKGAAAKHISRGGGRGRGGSVRDMEPAGVDEP